MKSWDLFPSITTMIEQRKQTKRFNNSVDKCFIFIKQRVILNFDET